jgi:hypothetical protein
MAGLLKVTKKEKKNISKLKIKIFNLTLIDINIHNVIVLLKHLYDYFFKL